MSGFNYAGAAATAQRIITRFGAAATLTRRAASPDYDPDTATADPAPTTDTVQAVVFPYQDRFDATVRQGDEQALVGAVGLSEPREGDALTTADGVTRQVIRTKNVGPAGVWVVFELHLRGASGT